MSLPTSRKPHTYVTIPMHNSSQVFRVESSRVESSTSRVWVQLELDSRSPSRTRLELDSREETREDSSSSFELKNPDSTRLVSHVWALVLYIVWSQNKRGCCYILKLDNLANQ